MSAVMGSSGQGIDPSLLAMMGSASSGQEDQANLQQQMLLANAMRQQGTMPQTHMAGRVAIRNSPMSYLGAAMSNYGGQQKQQQTLQQMQQQAAQLRAARAAYMAQVAQQQQSGQAPQAGAPTSDPTQSGQYDPSTMSPEEQALIQSQQQMQPGGSIDT